ncbi:PH domain-containing protein [Novilysobacter arseniciresistens]|uniref:PH domain-containing protein n=1 Tax=Novilysobacter arseniciresistens TaxID=1385522 RepID=UPI0006918912|nr:PH domain-containing protein [Lysobacter arseniciresistens]
MSWLFVLVAQLRQFIVPLLALLVFGQGDRNELWPLIGVGVLALVSLWQYFTYRYGVADDALVVRSGLLERSVRVIPFARIHNVALQQSVLHRLFDVAEVRLESAGGKKPEAEMRVLRLDDALALEALVRRRGRAAAAMPAGTDAATALLELPTAEVLRLGLVSNRGLILVGAAFAGVSQFNRDLIPQLFERWGGALFGWAGEHGFGPTQYLLAGASLVLLAVLLLRLLSVVLALLQYHGFRLSEHGRRLTVERGLAARWRTSASRRRIQAWTLREGLMHRWLGRRSLEVDTAVAEEQNQQRALREVAPIATPARCRALIDHLLPRARWDALEWRPVPPRSWWRRWLPSIPLTALAAAVLAWHFGGVGLLALAWLPWSAFVARRHAARAAWALGPELVAVREGWLARHWRFAELDKLQALHLVRSPLDRRCGTATLWLDTAGASPMAPPLRLRFLPLAEVEVLYARLSREVARRPLRW